MTSIRGGQHQQGANGTLNTGVVKDDHEVSGQYRHKPHAWKRYTVAA